MSAASPAGLAPDLPEVPPLDADVAGRAAARQARLVKPPGSLGALERLGVRLAAVLGDPRPDPRGAAVCVFAADHGVAVRGVSAYPPEVTRQMVATFAGGGSAVCALARSAGAELLVVDVGVAGPRFESPGVLDRRVREGSRDLTEEDALAPDELARAVAAGREAAARLHGGGADLLVGGEMGIGNTTSAAALTAALLGVSAAKVVGRGTGVDDAGLERKRRAVAAGLARRPLTPDDPLDALRSVGGLEIAALVGFYLEGAARGAALLLDGFIATAAALAAARLRPHVAERMVAGHRSAERAHALQLRALGLEPLLDLGLRLGEGSGAVAALPLVRAAAAVQREMATFEEAGVASGAGG